MKSLRFIFQAVAVLIMLMLLCLALAEASDLSYPTLIPQNGDTELVIQHKAEVSQAKLANGATWSNVVTTLSGTTVTITSGTTTVATGGTVTSGTMLLTTGTGVLERVIVNQGGAGDKVLLLDGTDSGGTAIGTVTAATAPNSVTYGVRYTTGLTVISTGTNSSDVTVTYR